MKTLSDVRQKLEEIRNSDFKIGTFNYYDETHKVSHLLRSALVCSNNIGRIDGISNEEERNLYHELNEIMKFKYKMLNPNLGEQTLERIISGYQRGSIIYPMDTFVIDDAVFHKEAVYDDFGSIYKIRTFMFDGPDPYYDVESMYFTLDDYTSIFEKKERVYLTREEDMIFSKFISDYVNSIYNDNITKALYELNTDRVIHGYSGLTIDPIFDVKIYMNTKLPDIGRDIKAQKEAHYKLCFQNGDDMTLYYIHQQFIDGKPVWELEKTVDEVWRLSDAALNFGSETPTNPHGLTK